MNGFSVKSKEGKKMGVSEKTSKISSITAVICIVIYIAAIGFGAVRIIANIGDRKKTAENEFYDLADRASSSAVFLGFMSEPYQETIRDYLGISETLLGVIITGSNGEYAFERYPGSGIIWAGEFPRLKTGAGFPAEPFHLPLRVEGQRNVNIQAVYSYIDNDLFLGVLRDTLIAVLAALAIALAALIIEMSRKKKASYYRSELPADNFTSSAATGNAAGYAAGYAAESSAAAAESKPAQLPDYESGVTDDMFLPEESGEESYEISPFGDVSFEETSDPAADSPEDKNPLGLYTPRGNIGWESYTLERLNSELHRCASSEQDLTLLAMGFRNDENMSDTLYRQFTDEAAAYFAMRDLIFEKGGNGISVIIPSVDLEYGIARAEEFRGRITAALPETFDRTLCIGLSSRSGRLIEAERMILEASTALKKATADPVSPIIAFKSDPEKYREFLKNK